MQRRQREAASQVALEAEQASLQEAGMIYAAKEKTGKISGIELLEKTFGLSAAAASTAGTPTDALSDLKAALEDDHSAEGSRIEDSAAGSEFDCPFETPALSDLEMALWRYSGRRATVTGVPSMDRRDGLGADISSRFRRSTISNDVSACRRLTDAGRDDSSVAVTDSAYAGPDSRRASDLSSIDAGWSGNS